MRWPWQKQDRVDLAVKMQQIAAQTPIPNPNVYNAEFVAGATHMKTEILKNLWHHDTKA